jgi:hypothetical protein
MIDTLVVSDRATGKPIVNVGAKKSDGLRAGEFAWLRKFACGSETMNGGPRQAQDFGELGGSDDDLLGVHVTPIGFGAQTVSGAAH